MRSGLNPALRAIERAAVSVSVGALPSRPVAAANRLWQAFACHAGGAAGEDTRQRGEN